MKKFITQLRENTSAIYDDFAISSDVIEFVSDLFAINPGKGCSNTVNMVMLLYEAAIQS